MFLCEEGRVFVCVCLIRGGQRLRSEAAQQSLRLERDNTE